MLPAFFPLSSISPQTSEGGDCSRWHKAGSGLDWLLSVGKANKTGYPVLSSGETGGGSHWKEMPEGSGLKDLFGLMVSETSVCGELVPWGLWWSTQSSGGRNSSPQGSQGGG